MTRSKEQSVRRAVRACVLSGTCLTLAALGAAPGRGAEPQHPSLAGSWVFNAQLTANLAKDQQADSGTTDDALGDKGHHHSGMGGGQGPQGDMDVGSGTGKKAKPEDDEKKSQSALFEALDTLTIAQQPGQVTITDRTGHARVLKTDGSKVRDASGPGGGADLRAGWNKDNDLDVQVKPDKGSKRTESYAVSHDGKHLYLTFTNSRFVKTIRAYDVAPATTGTAGAPADPAASAVPAPSSPPAAAPPPTSTPPPAAAPAVPPPGAAPGERQVAQGALVEGHY